MSHVHLRTDPAGLRRGALELASGGSRWSRGSFSSLFSECQVGEAFDHADGGEVFEVVGPCGAFELVAVVTIGDDRADRVLDGLVVIARLETAVRGSVLVGVMGG